MPQPHDSLSVAHVQKLARLARLDVGDANAQRFAHELAAVLGYVERLRTLDLSSVEPMATPLDACGPLAPDEPGTVLPTAVLKQMAPETFDEFVKVPKVLGEGSA